MEDETCSKHNAVHNLPLLSAHFVQDKHYKHVYLVFP
jgi:hypothetical protein